MSITIIIIIITALISFNAFSNRKIYEDMVFYPPSVTFRNQWYRFLSCALIHADPPHLIFNMLSFYFFGQIVERNFSVLFGSAGPILYIALYVVSQFLCLIPTYIKNKENYNYSSVGASGAVSAVVFAGIVLFPLAPLNILFIPIDIPGFIFGFLYLGITAYLDKKGGSNINHSAHLFGAIAGIGMLLVFGYAFSDFDLLQNFIMQIKSFGGR